MSSNSLIAFIMICLLVLIVVNSCCDMAVSSTQAVVTDPLAQRLYALDRLTLRSHEKSAIVKKLSDDYQKELERQAKQREE